MSIFRSKALTRLSTPDNLDAAIGAASPMHWIVCLAVLVVMSSALAGSVLGTVPTRVQAEGIVLKRDSEVFSATAEGSGEFIRIRTVDAPITDTVTEISASLDGVVAPGTLVIRIVSEAASLLALLFISPADGTLVKLGFNANVEPSVAKKEEYGTILTSVRSIARLPMSGSAIQAMLHNAKLVEQFRWNGSPVATLVVFAHGLSTAVNTDRIYVIEADRVVQARSYADFLKSDGPFCSPAQRQIG